jgi:RNA polymerase sigma-70 factor (ECF subfamily)
VCKLFTLSWRLILTRLRRTERRREEPLEAAGEPARPDREIERLDVERLIARLPDKLRTVLVLKEIEGYSHGEIGRLLGISESASEVRLYRAKQLLRKQLRDT